MPELQSLARGAWIFAHWWKLLPPLQTFPPVAVLAIAVPGDWLWSATSDYRLDPLRCAAVLQATLAGLGAIDASVTEVAKGMGMSRGQRLRKVELPLAAPVILGACELR